MFLMKFSGVILIIKAAFSLNDLSFVILFIDCFHQINGITKGIMFYCSYFIRQIDLYCLESYDREFLFECCNKFISNWHKEI